MAVPLRSPPPASPRVSPSASPRTGSASGGGGGGGGGGLAPCLRPRPPHPPPASGGGEAKRCSKRPSVSSPSLVGQHRLGGRLVLRPHRHVVRAVLELDHEAGGQHVLALLVELHAVVAHDELVG